MAVGVVIVTAFCSTVGNTGTVLSCDRVSGLGLFSGVLTAMMLAERDLSRLLEYLGSMRADRDLSRLLEYLCSMLADRDLSRFLE